MNDAPLADLAADTRGIIDPATMARHVTLTRYPAGAVLDGLVEWFWAVRWEFPPGHEHVQRVLNHPTGHISVGTAHQQGAVADVPVGRVYGVITELSHRRLRDTGWTVAAKTTTGGLGALLGRPARTVTDRELTLDEAFPAAEAALALEQGAGEVDMVIDLGAVKGGDWGRAAVRAKTLENFLVMIALFLSGWTTAPGRRDGLLGRFGWVGVAGPRAGPVIRAAASPRSRSPARPGS